MFRNSYQHGLLTVFFSCGAKPFTIWDTFIKDGYINRFLDPDIKSLVYEIGGTNISTTYIVCPKGKTVLGITMPFLIMIVKNLKKYFSFEVTALDDTGTRRRFRISNFQSTTQILPLCTVMPIGLSEGWNQIQFNIAEFMRRAYQKKFVEVQKLKINANIRLRRIYFAERLLPEDELPAEYKLYFPLSSKHGKKSIKNKENVQPSTIAPPADSSKLTMSSKQAISKSATHMQETVTDAPKQGMLPVTEAAGIEEKANEQQGIVAPTVENSEVTNTAEVSTQPENEKSTMNEGGELDQSEVSAETTTEGQPASQPIAATEEQVEDQAVTATEAQAEGQPAATTEIQAEGETVAAAEVQAESQAEATAEALAEAPAETLAEAPAETLAEAPAVAEATNA